MAKRAPLAYTLAIISGMGLWFWASVASGKREAWDDTVYWTVTYPIAVGLAGVLGFAFPQRPWRWALTLFLAQFAAMAIRNGEIGSMWPLGLAALVVLSLPGIARARFGAWLRGKAA